MDSYRRRLACSFPIVILFFLSSCGRKAEVTRGFYYWRSDWPAQEERDFLKKQQVKKLYARLMDVDWSETQGAIPVARVSLDPMHHELVNYDSLPVEMVPVVFITNKTFEKIDSLDLPLLARRIVRRCLPSYDETDIAYEKRTLYDLPPMRPKEIQIDCDWTARTSAKYFRFLRLVKSLLPADSIVLSATVRLHQYRHFDKTGIPPADRGMLMMYNLTDPKKFTTANSIFEEPAAKAYFTSGRKYPLPLDIALPTWSWCIIFRNKEFYQIENGLSEQDLVKLDFLQPAGNHFFKVTRDTVYRDLFLRPGDEIKAESISHEQLQQAARLAKQAANTDRFTVSFFELNYNDIKQLPDETFERLYTDFR